MRKHLPFWAAFFLMGLAFLYPLLGTRSGFTTHDYALQCHPWTLSYANALKQGTLLLWTPLIQCGFPLFAEGQTGMLYPLNLILFAWLPFKAAYNGMFLLHYFLAGAFMYGFALKKGLTPPAAAVATLAFTFGSAYAGLAGSFFAMRTLVWFPLALWAAEELLEKRRPAVWALLAFALAMSWLAGAPQSALYAAAFVTLYFLVRARGRFLDLVLFFAAMAVSVLIALPQLWATAEMASHSARNLQDPSFALWGSLAPWSLSTLFMYSWGTVMRASLYIGVAPLFLIALSPSLAKRRLWWCLAALGLFMALGSFNPIYWLLVQLPAISLLRNPSKFIFFAIFFLSLLAGSALDDVLSWPAERRSRALATAIRRCCALTGIFLGVATAAWATVRFGQAGLARFGQWYVDHFVMGRSYHRGSAEHYAEKTGAFLRFLSAELDASNPFFWLPFGIAAVFIALLALWRSQKISPRTFQLLLLLLLCWDLLWMGKGGYGVGIQGNIGPFPRATDHDGFMKDGRWADLAAGGDRIFPPNRNMNSGHASVGAYSPLVDKDYFLAVRELGVADDSLGRLPGNAAAWTAKRELVNFLGVKYVLADENVRLTGYPVVKTKDGLTLYSNPDAKAEFAAGPGVHFISMASGPDWAVIRLRADTATLLTRNQTYDAGWRVKIDGAPAALERAHAAFQAVRVPAGQHEITFDFIPDYARKGLFAYAAGWLLIAAVVLAGIRNISVVRQF